jgi:ketosteroid isomerase-like protein
MWTRKLEGPGLVALLWALAAVPALYADEEDDRAALRVVKSVYEQAVNDDKLDLLAPHMHADFRGVMITSEPVVGLEGMKAYWKKLKEMIGPAGRYHVTVTPEPAQFVGDMAFEQGVSEDVMTLPGHEYRVAGQWTAVCRKQDGVWKLYRIHVSMDPLGNSFVMERLRAGRLLFGGALLAGGLVGGSLIGLALGRRRPPP